MWHIIKSIEEVPIDCDLRLAVIDAYGIREPVFPCRRVGSFWVEARTRYRIEISPTHWQEWTTDIKSETSR